MTILDNVSKIVEPVLGDLGLDLYDIEHNGGILRVTVTAPDGLGIDSISEASRAISRSLDEHDPMPGAYTLEVSSPGLERKLRTPTHFDGAIGELIVVKLGPHVDGDRRLRGVLVASDDGAVTIETDAGSRVVALGDITKATTVFEWGPSSKRTKKNKNKQAPTGPPGEEAPESPSAGAAAPAPEADRRASAR